MDFTVVQSKVKKKHQNSKKLSKVNDSRDSSPVKVDFDKLSRQLKNCEEELQISEFFQLVLDLIKKQTKEVKEIICLGIGKFIECSIARHQLAFISLIGKQLKVAIRFFDPILSTGENELLKKLNFEVITENKEGSYLAEDPTLFFLPHCPKEITNNLLYTNWSSDHIQNVYLICNSFRSIIEKSPERLLRPIAHYILEASSFVEELYLQNIFRYTDIFNDLSIHSFPPKNLETTDSCFWLNKPKPIYTEEDIEIVQSNGSC